MTALYISFTLAIALLTLVSGKRIRAILFVGAVILAPIIYFDTLSKPKLLTDEWRSDEQVRILGYTWTEGVAVYYWLILPGVQEPRYYYEPWTEESRKRVEELQRGKEEGRGMMFKYPFEHSWETEKPKTIHPLPQPKLPQKEAPPPVQEFSI